MKIKKVVFLFSILISASAWNSAVAAKPIQIQLNWLDGTAPQVEQGVSWGVPWPKGALQKETPMRLTTVTGESVSVQTWPLAYWPDGSVKWSGHAINANANVVGPLNLSVATTPLQGLKIIVNEDADKFTIDTGKVRAQIAKSGKYLIESLRVGDREVAEKGRLMMVREDRSNFSEAGILRYEEYVGAVTQVTLEQSGPVRVVVKIEGSHLSANGAQSLLPFVVRLYFYADSPAIRMVHSFVYDGQQETDFIKGIGVTFSVPFQEELHNRHVRFVGDGSGVWAQPVRLLPGYRARAGVQITDHYADHLAGKRMLNLAEYDQGARDAAESVAVYDAMRLTQTGPNNWSIYKRTQEKSSWLHVTDGKRSKGLAVLGDVSGGIAVGLKNFWEKHPSSIQIKGATSASGDMQVWFWSPEAEAMDLRHYDTIPHGLQISYEDWKPGWATPLGVANTSELTLWAFDAIPSHENLLEMAELTNAAPMLVCTPEYYHEQQAFGSLWGLPDRSTPTLAWLEDQVSGLVDYYRDQVEERSWYGFWDFGDWMHNYDYGRHEWRYDIGGWAWINTELMPDILAWYSFLRTGRADYFRLAEAMTRQTSEVDVHHIGPFAPLGSRHNVKHWGDGAKQPRISHSGIKNFLYYLTADDRVGDLMREQIDADLTFNYLQQFNGAHYRPTNDGGYELDGPRARPSPRPEEFAPLEPRNTRPEMSLNWICYAMNWMTEWERTGDPEWRDYIMKDIETILSTPLSERPISHFSILFGSPENMSQMEPMFDSPDFWKRWIEVSELFGRSADSSKGVMGGPRMLAIAAHAQGNSELGVMAWKKLIGNALNDNIPPAILSQPAHTNATVNPVNDPVFLGKAVSWQQHGPASVQWALSAITTSALAREWLDEWEAEKK